MPSSQASPRASAAPCSVPSVLGTPVLLLRAVFMYCQSACPPKRGHMSPLRASLTLAVTLESTLVLAVASEEPAPASALSFSMSLNHLESLWQIPPITLPGLLLPAELSSLLATARDLGREGGSPSPARGRESRGSCLPQWVWRSWCSGHCHHPSGLVLRASPRRGWE